MLIIGIGHRKHSGKDTLAKMILNYIEYSINPRITHFADPLKAEVADVCGIDIQVIQQNKDVFRPMLQWWGTEFRRVFAGDNNYWVDRTAETVEYYKAEENCKMVIIPDVRFENEADWIKSQGGKLIKIDRPSIQSIDTHPSETSLLEYPGWDMIVQNDSTPDHLLHKAKGIVNSLIVPNL